MPRVWRINGEIPRVDFSICYESNQTFRFREMTRVKIPVLSGFVVLAPAFGKFLKETNLDIETEAGRGIVIRWS